MFKSLKTTNILLYIVVVLMLIGAISIVLAGIQQQRQILNTPPFATVTFTDGNFVVTSELIYSTENFIIKSKATNDGTEIKQSSAKINCEKPCSLLEPITSEIDLTVHSDGTVSVQASTNWQINITYHEQGEAHE